VPAVAVTVTGPTRGEFAPCEALLSRAVLSTEEGLRFGFEPSSCGAGANPAALERCVETPNIVKVVRQRIMQHARARDFFIAGTPFRIELCDRGQVKRSGYSQPTHSVFE
jgi:hypothetical protein